MGGLCDDNAGDLFMKKQYGADRFGYNVNVGWRLVAYFM